MSRRPPQRTTRTRRRGWRSPVTQLCIGSGLLVAGVVGLVIRANTPNAAIEQLDLHGQRWTFTLVLADDRGVGALAADGIVDYREGNCASAGRFYAGELIVNPASAPADVQRLLDEFESSVGVGRIVSARQNGMYRPDGVFDVTVPLGPFAGAEVGDSLCDSIIYTTRHLELVSSDVVPTPISALDAGLAADDARLGRTRQRYRDGRSDELPALYEIYVEADSSRGILVRNADGTPAARIHLTVFGGSTDSE